MEVGDTADETEERRRALTLTEDVEVTGGLVLEHLGAVEAEEEERRPFGPGSVLPPPPPPQRFFSVLSSIYTPEV